MIQENVFAVTCKLLLEIEADNRNIANTETESKIELKSK